MVALLAGAVAAQNGAARMLFALGRDGLLPRQLGRAVRRFGTPAAALTVVLGAAIALGLGFGFGFQPVAAVAAIIYLFIKNVSPQPPYPSNLAIWIAIGWLVAGILVLTGLVIFKPGRLSEAAVIIGEGDAPAANIDA